MNARRAALVAAPLAIFAATGANAQSLGSYVDQAYDACTSHIDSAYNALNGVCTAAAVIDLALSPESANCTVARIAVVEYVKACIKTAADMLAEGGPVELPPFPTAGDLGMVGDGALQPMPPGWPAPPGADPMALFGLLFADQQFLIANVHALLVAAVHEQDFQRTHGMPPMALYGAMIGAYLGAEGRTQVEVGTVPIVIYDTVPNNGAVSAPAEDVSVGPADAGD